MITRLRQAILIATLCIIPTAAGQLGDAAFSMPLSIGGSNVNNNTAFEMQLKFGALFSGNFAVQPTAGAQLSLNNSTLDAEMAFGCGLGAPIGPVSLMAHGEFLWKPWYDSFDPTGFRVSGRIGFHWTFGFEIAYQNMGYGELQLMAFWDIGATATGDFFSY